MADNIEVGDLVARISFDDTGLNKSMAEIDRQMKLVKSEFDKASSSLQGYGSEEDKLKAKSNSLNQQLQLQQQRVNKLNDEFQKAAREKGADAQQTQKLAVQLNKAQAEYNKIETELKQTNSQLNTQEKELNQLQKAWGESMEEAQRSVGNISEQLKRVGAGITAFGVGVAAALGVAVNKAADFEQGMANAYSVMDPAEVSTFRDELEQLAVQLGADTKYSATEAAKGIEELIKAGVSVQDVLGGGLSGALSLATAGELALGDAAEIASTALNAFKADAISVQDAADILAGAANASATSVSEMKFSLSAVSAVASGVGLSFQDTATALAVFAQNGLKGSDAGTSLKTMLLRLTPTTDAAASEFDRLGLYSFDAQKAMSYLVSNGITPASDATRDIVDAMMTYAAEIEGVEVGSDKANKAFNEMAFNSGAMSSEFYDANGNLKSMAEIAGILQNALKDMTSEQRQVTLNTLFGQDAIRGANILFKEGAEGINNMAAAMGKISAADVAKQKMDTLKGAMEELNGSMETAQISIGNALLPMIRSVAAGVQQLVDWFNAIPESMQSFIAIGGAVAAALALIIGPIILLIGFLPNIIAGFTALAPVAGAFGSVLTALTGPIGITIAAIAGIVTALTILYNKNETVRTFIDETWTEIKETLQQAWQAIVDFVMPLINDLVSFFKTQFNMLKEFWQDHGDKIKAIIEPVFKFISGFIKFQMEAIKTTITVAWAAIKGAVKIAIEGIKLVISNTLDLIIGAVKIAMKIFQGDWKGAWEEVKNLAKNIWGNIETFFKNIDLVQIGKDIMSGLIKGIKSMAGAVVDTAKEVADSIGKGIKKVLGINSPSKVTTQLGVWTGEGLAIGMDKTSRLVAQQAAKLSEAAVPSISQPTSGIAAATSRQAAAGTAAMVEPYMITVNTPVYLDGKLVAVATNKPQADMMRLSARGMGMA